MVLQRPVMNDLPVYKQGAAPEGPDSFKLSSNENPFGPLPSVVDAVASRLGLINTYPAISAPELTDALSVRLGVDAECLAFGAGSVEVASQLIHASAGAGDEVIFAWRSFEAYPSLVKIAGATPVMVPLTADHRHDLDAMADAVTENTRLILICNPNNPTGGVVSTAELDAFMARVPSNILVVVDEAYVHFNTDPDTAVGLDFFRRYQNVAVLHTFSKAYGLAGLRVGYAIARPEVAANLRRVSVPFAVSDLAQHAAVTSLAVEPELEERIAVIRAERARVEAALDEQGWGLERSHGNFVWLNTGAATVAVNEVLIESGILGRAFPGEGIRVSIGSAAANDRFIEAARRAHKLS